MKKMYLITLFFSLAILMGCNQNNDNGNNDVIAKAALKTRLDGLQSDIEILQEQINLLSYQLYLAKNLEAEFSPGSKGYATINSNVGSFVISLVNLTKYADGYKAQFNIGNPSQMVFNGAKIIVHWGKPFATGQNYIDWHKALKTQEVSITKPLLPGVWNKVSITLSPATAEETGYIGISIEANQVILLKDYRDVGT